MTKIKFIISAALVAMLSSCSVPKTAFIQSIHVLDYAAASQGGKILLTEAPSVSFEYTSLASVLITEESGYEIAERTTKTKVEEGFGETFGAAPVRIEKQVESIILGDKYRSASPQSALDAAAKAALKMGGDAIIGLKVEPIYSELGKERTPVGYSVTGMVIKRK